MKTNPLLLISLAAALTWLAGDWAHAYYEDGRQAEIRREFEDRGLRFGAPVVLRSFKRTSLTNGISFTADNTVQQNLGVVEVWVRGPRGEYVFLKSYRVCAESGYLGPKTREGDYQEPEGVYSIGIHQLRPNSNYDRAIDTGYPNAYDRSRGRTGGLVEIHGGCRSDGCLAMTNEGIEEIYLIVRQALISNPGTSVPLYIFPFPMTDRNFEIATDAIQEMYGGERRKWESRLAAWEQLRDVYDSLGMHHRTMVSAR